MANANPMTSPNKKYIVFDGNRTPSDTNLGDEQMGSANATEIWFSFTQDNANLADCSIVANCERNDGETSMYLLSKQTVDTINYYVLPISQWMCAKKGNVNINISVYRSANPADVTVDEGVITVTATSPLIIISEVFVLRVNKSPTLATTSQAFDPTDWQNMLLLMATKADLDEILVICSALPNDLDTLVTIGGVEQYKYQGRYLFVSSDGLVYEIYYCATNTPVVIESKVSKDKITTLNGYFTTGVLKVANGGTGNSAVDTAPVENSTKMLPSGKIYDALALKASLVNLVAEASARNLADEVLDSKINEIVASTVDGAISQEVINARDSEVSLSARFDRQKAKIAQKRKAFITIVDDDGRSNFVDDGFATVITAHPNCIIALAINPNYIGTTNYMSWAQIEAFNTDSQYEILNHGYSHAEPLNLTLSQIQANYLLEKASFESHSLAEFDYYVYAGYTPAPANPNQDSNAVLKNKLKQVYKCSLMNTASKTPYIPFELYDVRRVSAYVTAAAEAYVDFCIANKCWCILFGHSYMAGQTSTLLDTILTYIDTKVALGLIEYVTVKDMIDNNQNIIEMGNGIADGEHFILSKNGEVDFSIQGKDINAIKQDQDTLLARTYFKSSYFVDADITSYTANSITIEPIDYTVATNLGLPDAGIVQTVRNVLSGTYEIFDYQLYTKFNNNDMYMRKWIYSLSRWGLFAPISSISCTSTTRPRYAQQGQNVYDSTLSKPIWQHYSTPYTANKTLARNTAYKKWDVVNESDSNMYLCIFAGTTGANAPTWNTGATYNNTVDGTATWQFLGASKSFWCDATGTNV